MYAIMTKEELLEILSDLHPEVDFETETSLVDDKIFTSFDIVAITAEISDSFDILIPAGEIRPENFNSLDALYALIQKVSDED